MTYSKMIAALCFALFLVNCSNTSSTNKLAEGDYKVRSNVGAVNYKITKELVEGEGCSGSFLGIPTGASEFVSSGVDTSSKEGKAKAAAMYNALYGDEKKKLGMDIIAQPQFRIVKKGLPLVGSQVCAKVIGYRAVVASVKN